MSMWTLVLLLAAFARVSAFTSIFGANPREKTVLWEHCDEVVSADFSGGRRKVLSTVVGSLVFCAAFPLPGRTVTEASETMAIEMKTFIDPVGYFSIDIPKSFFALRRSAKGDLPDEKTGRGRKGSSIFTAGDIGKAEVVAVERFPTRLLLEENGIEATGSLATFPDLGEPSAVANLLNLRREKDKGGMSNSQIIPGSLFISPDGKELRFKLKTEIEVQKPELLMETYGVSELFRITTVKATLRSNDGNLMAVFASALEKDFMGPDGVALQEAVNSFAVTDQSLQVAAAASE